MNEAIIAAYEIMAQLQICTCRSIEGEYICSVLKGSVSLWNWRLAVWVL